MKFKLIVSDIDGVWTDGSFYYSEAGDLIRKFTTRDSYGVKLCQLLKLPVLILSTEDSPIVKKRMEKLEIKFVKLGVRNKLKALSRFCENQGFHLEEVAFIGDDMNDYHLMGKVGYFACPGDAYISIKEKADLVLNLNGGQGAFREFVEHLLKKENLLEVGYAKYLEECLEK